MLDIFGRPMFVWVIGDKFTVGHDRICDEFLEAVRLQHRLQSACVGAAGAENSTPSAVALPSIAVFLGLGFISLQHLAKAALLAPGIARVGPGFLVHLYRDRLHRSVPFINFFARPSRASLC